MTKCKYIDSLFEKGKCKSEVLEIINEKYPKANNSGTVAARYSFFNKENPDHLIKFTMETAKKDLLKRAKKDPSIDTDYIMLTADQTHEVGGNFPRPDFVSCPDNDDDEIVIEQYFFVGDPKTYKKFPGKRELAKRQKAHVKAWEKKKNDDKKAEEKAKDKRRVAREKKAAMKGNPIKTATKKAAKKVAKKTAKKTKVTKKTSAADIFFG